MNLSGPRHSVGKSVYFRRPARIPSATLAPAPKHQGQRRSRVQGGRAKAPGQLSRWPVSGKLKRSGQGWAATPVPGPWLLSMLPHPGGRPQPAIRSFPPSLILLHSRPPSATLVHLGFEETEANL